VPKIYLGEAPAARAEFFFNHPGIAETYGVAKIYFFDAAGGSFINHTQNGSSCNVAGKRTAESSG